MLQNQIAVFFLLETLSSSIFFFFQLGSQQIFIEHHWASSVFPLFIYSLKFKYFLIACPVLKCQKYRGNKTDNLWPLQWPGSGFHRDSSHSELLGAGDCS